MTTKLITLLTPFEALLALADDCQVSVLDDETGGVRDTIELREGRGIVSCDSGDVRNFTGRNQYALISEVEVVEMPGHKVDFGEFEIIPSGCETGLVEFEVVPVPDDDDERERDPNERGERTIH